VSDLSRRDLVRALAGFAAAGAVDGLAARAVYALTREGAGLATTADGAYGPLAPMASLNTGETFLALPEGFSYTVFGRTGEPMTDGRPTPERHDGMAAFAVGGELRLVRNHETGRGPTPAAGPPERSYDRLAPGGTTTLVIDPATRLPTRHFVSLSGTLINCAGGPTPWGSWISCEETTAGPSRGFEQPHGYCFEVPAASDGPVDPVPLKAMGRFIHEAVAVDPETGIVYLTEDRLSAGFFRFLPDRPGELPAGGRLQMLAIRGQEGYDTRTGQRQGQELPVRWVEIGDPDPALAEQEPGIVFYQGAIAGGATFGRLEGAWYGHGRIYINSTNGGDAGLGQVWAYRRGRRGGTLRLLFESPSAEVLQAPDNLCVSPRGRGLVLCEDGEGDQYLRGLTRDGRIFDLARNVVPGYEGAEFAGATFSPDGSILFVNIQTPGLTFAIQGPWRSGAL